MDAQETLAFAQRLMREVWEPLDARAVPHFYHHDVIGHNRQQLLTYDDVVHRIVTDHLRYPNPVWLLSASGVVGLAHATRPATRALSRALPRRRALCTNWKKPR